MNEIEDVGAVLAAIRRAEATILLVDENAETRAIALDFLRGLGCQVVSVTGLVAAAYVLRGSPIGLVVARYDQARAHSAAAALRACAGEVPLIALSATPAALRALFGALGQAIEAQPLN